MQLKVWSAFEGGFWGDQWRLGVLRRQTYFSVWTRCYWGLYDWAGEQMEESTWLEGYIRSYWGKALSISIAGSRYQVSSWQRLQTFHSSCFPRGRQQRSASLGSQRFTPKKDKTPPNLDNRPSQSFWQMGTQSREVTLQWDSDFQERNQPGHVCWRERRQKFV